MLDGRGGGRPLPSIDRAKLRPASALDDAYDRSEAWHWRVNTGVSLSGRTRAIVADAAKAAKRNGWITRVVAGDFPYGGCAYPSLDEDRSSEAHSIAIELHYAFSWLTSDGVAWMTSTPTREAQPGVRADLAGSGATLRSSVSEELRSRR